MAEENRDWGYPRLQGALSNLGHEIAPSTIADILKRRGIEPAPDRKRKTTWKEFLSRHWELIVAADFFTVEVWTQRGLQRFVVLFFIELSTRRVEIAAIAAEADGLWMDQIGRNLTDGMDGILNGKRYLIHDRDPYAERFVRSIKESCLDRMILFGEGSLRKGIDEFVLHYHGERNHQSLGNRLIVPEPTTTRVLRRPEARSVEFRRGVCFTRSRTVSNAELPCRLPSSSQPPGEKPKPVFGPYEVRERVGRTTLFSSFR